MLKLDWVVISAVATALMAVATFVTLIQNRRQLKELKRQWHESNRAKLLFNVELIQGELYCLKIYNIGNSVASDIRFTINDDFVDKLLFQEARDILKTPSQKSLTILPHASKLFPISPNENCGNNASIGGEESHKEVEIESQLEKIKHIPIIITGRYNHGTINIHTVMNDNLWRSPFSEDIESNLIKIRRTMDKISNTFTSFVSAVQRASKN